ncbi:hypothetical protein Pint_20659 [Pistacia integerrima]|uniref:Uncharacterized protein n=1 Tax=Pistacia integerrima TaxID=434235 RepID=A0ACC0X7W0_9ROSI|nr:hypothetical protein Pint_20659 [Pistacia integerrima]
MYCPASISIKTQAKHNSHQLSSQKQVYIYRLPATISINKKTAETCKPGLPNYHPKTSQIIA